MSEEAKRLIDTFGNGLNANWPDSLSHAYPAYQELLAHIERIERERDEARAQVNAMSIYHEGDAVRDAEAAERIAALEAENAALRALRDLGEQP